MPMNSIPYSHIPGVVPNVWGSKYRFYLDRCGDFEAVEDFLRIIAKIPPADLAKRKVVTWAEAGNIRALYNKVSRFSDSGDLPPLSFIDFCGFLDWYMTNVDKYPTSAIKYRVTKVYAKTRKVFKAVKFIRQGKQRPADYGHLPVESLSDLELRLLTAFYVDRPYEPDDIEALNEAAKDQDLLRRVADWVMYYPRSVEEVLTSPATGKTIHVDHLFRNANNKMPMRTELRVLTAKGPVPLLRQNVVYDEDFPGLREGEEYDD
jgi:hypothetical protein